MHTTENKSHGSAFRFVKGKKNLSKKFWIRSTVFAVLASASFWTIAAKNFGPTYHVFVEPESDNLATGLVDELRYTTLADMEKAGLMKAELPVQPWSDSYWPIYKGVLANRYNDPGFPDSTDWKENADYVTARLGQGNVDLLSPAEKYDLLVGDKNFTLTKKMLAEGKPYYDRNREVETWMGLCHGWAPASFMEKRPQEKVFAKSADGEKVIPFYPSDIKALTTLLWASAWNTSTRFIGKRCRTESPPRDRTGRPLQTECLDTNAATWHLSAINQIGVAKRGFVMDATPDYEVWNHPVLGYSYSYFNPKTKQPSDSLDAATIKIAEFAGDPRAQYRAKAATAVVGIRMDVRYIVETFPSTRISDAPGFDATREVTYQYELEVDPNGTVLGGEWISSMQPDFLWTETKKSVPYTAGDQRLDQTGDRTSWSVDRVMPEAWKAAALQSSYAGQPLRRIVRKLIDSSQRI